MWGTEMSREDVLALADRIEQTPAYGPRDLAAESLHRTDRPPGTGSKRTKVILVNHKWRKTIASALRASIAGQVG